MIAAIQGRVIQIKVDSIILNVSGIGFRIHISPVLREQLHLEDLLFLHTYLVVREDSLTLYGFKTEEECEYFNLLLGVNGVGPRLSAAIIAALEVQAIRRAVLNEQADLFARVPGVGKRTAQKIVLHLQGKVGAAGVMEIEPVTEGDAEILAALTTLGYSLVEAQAAVQFIPKDAPTDIEERLKLALQFFSV